MRSSGALLGRDGRLHTPYKHDAFQPRYLVSDSVERTVAEVLALRPARFLDL